MRNRISMLLSSKHFVVFIFCAIFFQFSAKAQYDITVGTGTRANSSTKFPCPLQDTFTGSRAQYLFKASELNALGMDSGTITSVAFFVTKLNSYFGAVEGLSIKIGTTTATTLGATTWLTNLKTVYTAKDLNVTLGKNLLTFDSTYDWDGIHNLVLEVCNGSTIGAATSNPSVLQAIVTYNASRSYGESLPVGSLCNSTSTTNVDSSQRVRPVTMFNWFPVKFCGGIPVVGTVTASSLNVCPSIPLTLTSKGGTYAALITYQWQYLNPSTGLWDDTNPLDNSLSLTIFQDTTHSYRLKAICLATGDSAFSNVVTVTTPKVPGGNQYIINKNHTGNVWPLSDTFKSFNATLAAMSCGIKSAVTFTVLPGSGPYNEQMVVNGKIINSSDVNTITYLGNGETITFNPTTNSRAIIKLKGAKYFTFDSLVVSTTANSNYSIGFQFQNNADSNTVKRCTVNCASTGTGFTTLAASAGIVIGGTDANATGLDANSLCDNVNILNNSIKGGASGIVIAGGGGGENTYIVVKDNNIKDYYQHGIYINGTYNTTVEHNILSRPNTTSSPTIVDGIYIANLDRTLRVVRNRIHSPFTAQTITTSSFNGISLDAANAGTSPASVNEFHIANNLVYNIQGNGLQNGILNNNTSNVQLYHNTIALDDDLGNPTATAATTRCYMQNGLPTSITIVNNLFTIKRGGTSTKHCIYLGNPVAANFKDLSYNDYINDAAGGSNNYIGFWASNRLTIGDWITGSNEISALNIQPVYAEPITGNMDTAKYNPTNAFLDAKGKAVYEKIDILGTTTTRVDIGCYEFIPAPCIAANLNGLTEIYVNNRKVVSDTTLCEGINISLKLKITGATGAQTSYQWEKAQDDSNNTATPFGPSLIQPDTSFVSQALTYSDTTHYYRCKLSCQGADYFTNWRKISVRPAMVSGDYIINSNLPTIYIAGQSGGTFNTYDTAVKAMRYCGVANTVGNVIFKVEPLSGPYNEQILIDSIKGVTVNRQVVFKGNNTTIALPTTTPTAAERAVIKLQKAHYINFDSIIVDASQATTNGYGFQLLSNADSNSIKNCIINASVTQTGIGFAGIVINSLGTAAPNANGNSLCDANVIDNNSITGGYYGITLVGATGTGTSNNDNVISNNKITDFYNTGLFLSGTKNTTVLKNIFSRPTRTPVGVGYGINLSAAPSLASLVSKNRFTNFYGNDPTISAGAYGIYFNSVDASAGSEIVVVNNAFYNIGGTGALYALYNNNSDYVQYYHNSISIEDTTVATGLTAGFYQTGAAAGLVLKNNIIHIKRAGTANKFCINMQTVGSTGTALLSDYNDFSINPYIASNYTGNYGTGVAGLKKLLSDWQSVSGLDIHSVNYDPLFVDSKNGDLHPQFYLLNNLALPGYAVDDILNTPRPATPDMGAFEFSAPPCPNPLIAGTATVVPSSGICLEVPIHLSLTGGSPLGQINFQWQDSTENSSWQNLGPLNYNFDYDTVSSVRNYYRCIITCAATGASVISTTAVLNLNPILPKGTYYIDINHTPTSGPYQPGDTMKTFNEAVIAMQCGIRGSVVFDVLPGTYNEQVRMPYVAGTGVGKTITFRGYNQNSGGATLTFAPTVGNYTLRLDSAMYVTFRELNIENTDATNGRVVEFFNKTSNSSLLNCNINAARTVLSGTANAAIYATVFKGKNITIKGNNISNGSNGIYFAGINKNAGNLTIPGHIIDSNNVNTPFGTGIYVEFTDRLIATRNNVIYHGESGANISGIYASFCDSGFILKNNKVTLDSLVNAAYGIQVVSSRNKIKTGFAQVNGNQVYANNANTARIIGLAIITSDSIMVKNNVIGINSAGASSYGLQNTNNVANTTVYYYNNTVQVTVNDTTCNAAQLTQTNTGKYILNNNIFSNTGGGKAMYMSPAANFTSNYNMLYTSGKNLVATGNTTAYYQGINQWRKGSNQDKWSIVYQPAFVSATDLHPDVNSSDVWAIQGRATQIKGNTSDINDNYRPDSLLAGVPDLGAYEFIPNSQPTILPSIPATPTANTEQIFYFGSDTVMRITWDINPPATCNVKRFSGIVGQGIRSQGNCDSMYFYVQTDVPGGFAKGNVKLYYIAPWLGSFPTSTCGASEYQLGLGRTNPANIWTVNAQSRNNMPKKTIYENDITYFDKFTGLFNKYTPPPPPCGDTSNVGHEFYVAYPMHNQDLNGGNSSTFILYLAARDNAANVTVSYPGYSKIYFVPANTVVVSDPFPHSIQHQPSGTYDDAIHIESDEEIVAYAHCWASSSSGATMLMPVCTWGYEYKMLSKHEKQATDARAYYFVIAKEDNTKISYSSVVPNLGLPNLGEVVLNKGQWFQVFAASDADDLSGSVAKSIPNDQGICFPIAFFSGDMRTYIANGCNPGSGDFAMQQNFPASAWGKKYLTAPTSVSTGAGDRYKNWFRIGIKDVNQNIYINGTQVYPTGTPPSAVSNFTISSVLVPGTNIPAFIEFWSDSANYINSNKAMTIVQFLGSECGAEDGDPDMVYISPMEQGVNKINFYRNSDQTINDNVLTLIGSSTNVPSICEIQTAGGSCIPLTWDLIYPHDHYQGQSVYVKFWPTAAKRQVSVSGDSTFTAITYGLGSVESYMYNAGTNILSFTVPTDPPCNKGLDQAHCKSYTCSGTEFKIRTRVAVIFPDSIKFAVSHIPGIHPNTDVTIYPSRNPMPYYEVRPNLDTIWTFELPGYYKIDNPGTYTLVMTMYSPEIEGCDKSLSWQQYIQVLPSPKIGFTYSPNPICPNSNVNFVAGTVDGASFIPVNDWSWHSNPYGISADSVLTNTYNFLYGLPGTDTVKLSVRLKDNFCVGDSSQILTINPNPVVTVVADSIHTCAGGNVSFSISNPLSGATYTVYDAATGGNVIPTTGTTFTFNNVTADATYYIGCVSATGCVSVDRKAVKIKVTQLPTATATPTSVTACIGTSAVFNVSNPQSNTNYSWWDAATGGTQVGGNNTFTLNPVTANATYYLEASENGCVSATRFPVNVVAATPPSLAVVNNAVSVCSGDAATFSILNPDATVTYNWYTAATGGTPTNGTDYTINPATANGSYYVSATSAAGCTTSPRLQVDLTVKIRPVVTVVKPDSVTLCKGLTQTFAIQNPLAGAVYNWFNQSSGGTLVQANSSTFTTPPLVAGDTTYYVDGSKDGCVSFTRATVKIKALQELDTTSVKGTIVFTDHIDFTWTAVPNATGYTISVSLNGGTPPTVTTYGSGTLIHTLTGLKPGDTAWATVTALGINPCQNSISRVAFGKTVQNSTYYPNTFTPNGDGINDKIVICGSSFKDIKYAVYNQWGEKIWEASGLVSVDGKGCYLLWDGTQRGVLQPVGVYMFTSKITFLDGKVEEKKGTINLIR